MFTNITRAILALRILEESIPQHSPAGRLQVYTSALTILAEVEKNLDPEFIHHNYTRENLLRAEDAFAALCGFAQLAADDVNWNAIAGRLGPSLAILSDPSRWPSKCTLTDDAGVEHTGTNNPA